jgi:hypothetical protein
LICSWPTVVPFLPLHQNKEPATHMSPVADASLLGAQIRVSHAVDSRFLTTTFRP